MWTCRNGAYAKMTVRSYVTDLEFLFLFFPAIQSPMRQPASSPKIVSGPLKLRPDVAYTPCDRARDLLVAEMAKRRMTYKELARLLEPYGIDETPDQINRKVNRKRFSAAFLLACLAAMGVTAVQVPTQLGKAKSRP